jgi:DNA-binding CsgD family transcriptional regulator
VLYGRDVERARIDALLSEARSARSGVLVVRGEAGIGKSALLDHAVAGSGELPVLRAAGVESESELAFAGLHQLLRPVLGLLSRLPEGQAAALASALGLAGGEVNDRFLVSLGVLGLVSEVAEEEGGLLCVVDDAQWLDRPSAEALVFVARRLEAEGVVVLLAAREGDARQFESPGLPELRLAGLPAEPAAALLAERAGPALSSAVRDRLLAFSQGNPLAIMELPTSLSAEQLAGREPLIEPLPVGEGLERAFLGRIRALDPPAQQLALLAAADDSGELAPVLRAAEVLGADIEALDQLEAAELLQVDGATITFRHPLVRSAVYRRAGFNQREAAHLALAGALPDEADADRRAWHLAAASPGPDASVAAELEHSAVRARLRGGHAAAATALERAAQLSEDDASRARRLLAAAEANWLGGRAQRAGPLVEQAELLLTDPELRAQAALLRGSYEFERGRAGEAYDVLVAGAEGALAVDPRMALEMLVRGAEAASFSARMNRSASIAELASGVGATHEEELFMVALLEGTAQLMGGEPEPAVATLDRARRLADDFEHPRYLTFAAFADSFLGDFVTGQLRHARAVARLRAAGAVGDLPVALQLLAAAEVWLGRFGAAAANAAEGLRLALETGQDTNASFQLGTLARAEAPQGREAECREHAGEAMELAVARGLPLPGSVALFALGVLELGLGRPEEALAHATAITDPSSGLAHPLVAIYTAPDLVEAAVRSGRADLAGPALERFVAWAELVPARWPLAVTARMRALLAEGAEGDEHFEAALRRHADAELPFEHARTRLLYGEHLRRSRRRSDARPQLRAALAGFERLGARPWADRARGELRATGETSRKREPSTIDQLTPQELQIARFVSEGATNREVATKLFLSPRTVEYHLHKVFTKLGIASRGELPRLLPEEDAAVEEAPPVTSDRA